MNNEELDSAEIASDGKAYVSFEGLKAGTYYYNSGGYIYGVCFGICGRRRVRDLRD